MIDWLIGALLWFLLLFMVGAIIGYKWGEYLERQKRRRD